MPQVSYELPDREKVSFDIDPVDGWQPVGLDDVVGQINTAIGPLVSGARAVLDRLKEIGPDEIEVKFGVKVSGTANWVVAKAATEGNFEVTLTWKHTEAAAGASKT